MTLDITLTSYPYQHTSSSEQMVAISRPYAECNVIGNDAAQRMLTKIVYGRDTSFGADSYGLPQRHGRCEPRGSGAADRTFATVVKAPDGDGLLATSAETDATQCGVQPRTTASCCVVLRRTLVEELVNACRGSGGTLLTHVTASAC